jgi:hypothetical protein
VLNPPALSSSASSRASARLRARVVFVRRPRSRRSERSRLAVDRPASAAAAWRSSSASRSESVTSCPITSSVTIEQQHARKGLFLSSAGAAAAARQPRGADQRQISACVAFPPESDSPATGALVPQQAPGFAPVQLPALAGSAPGRLRVSAPITHQGPARRWLTAVGLQPSGRISDPFLALLLADA